MIANDYKHIKTKKKSFDEKFYRYWNEIEKQSRSSREIAHK
jgi:hypothetical protein